MLRSYFFTSISLPFAGTSICSIHSCSVKTRSGLSEGGRPGVKLELTQWLLSLSFLPIPSFISPRPLSPPPSWLDLLSISNSSFWLVVKPKWGDLYCRPTARRCSGEGGSLYCSLRLKAAHSFTVVYGQKPSSFQGSPSTPDDVPATHAHMGPGSVEREGHYTISRFLLLPGYYTRVCTGWPEKDAGSFIQKPIFTVSIRTKPSILATLFILPIPLCLSSV